MNEADAVFIFRQRNSDELRRSRKIGEPKAREFLEFWMRRGPYCPRFTGAHDQPMRLIPHCCSVYLQWFVRLEATEPTEVARVRAEIVAYVDATPSGSVECRLVDSHGRVWSFFENVKMVTEAAINAFTTYPQPGAIACQVVAQAGGVMTIDTTSETGVQSVEGQTRFEVPESLLVAWS